MDDPFLTSRSEPASDTAVAELNQRINSLRSLLKLVLISVFVATSALTLFLYRQTDLMQRQINAQRATFAEAEKKHREVVLKGLDVLRQYGAQDPVYASNVLAKFGLTALVPTNTPAGKR